MLFGPFRAALICSTVFSVRIPRGFLAAKYPLEPSGIESALIAAEHLGAMIGRKRTIALMPQATALKRRWLRTLRSLLEMIRIGVGQSGG
jgi:hypothetical protein